MTNQEPIKTPETTRIIVSTSILTISNKSIAFLKITKEVSNATEEVAEDTSFITKEKFKI